MRELLHKAFTRTRTFKQSSPDALLQLASCCTSVNVCQSLPVPWPVQGCLPFFSGHLTHGQCGATLASLHKQQVNTSLVYYRAPPGPNATFVFVRVVVCCSTANASGLDPRASLWAPMPTFDEKEQLWHLFYVQYFSAPSNASGSVCPHGERPLRRATRCGRV